MSREARERLCSGSLVSVLMIICGRSQRHICSAIEELLVFNASAFTIWLDFAMLHPHVLRHSFAADIQRNGATYYGVTGDARPFKRGDYAAIFAWTGRANGNML